MTEPLGVGIHGAGGRVGRRLIALASADPAWRIAGAVVSGRSRHLGEDAGTLAGVAALGIPLAASFAQTPQVIIDFSAPQGTLGLLPYCTQYRIPLVVATTGFSETEQQTLQAAAQTIPLCVAPNMSLAVNLTMKLAEVAAQGLAQVGRDVDVEIIERHHRFKADSPSGTALRFGQLIARTLGQTRHQHGRVGDVGARPLHEIGYHAVRAGDDPGQHTILFGMLGETIELRVAASNRDCYASGALAAARFLVGRAPGLYTMAHVLGLETR